jgi:hypothetical protein
MALACLALAWVAALGTVDEARADLALVVTNNRSLGLGRPDLQYADDDGAKWQELFEGLYGPEHTTLLTTFDPPSRALFPDLATTTLAPTLANLQAALGHLAVRLAAEPAGRRVATLVFAGHGDVADGEGFLELEDARLTATQLEAMLKALPADRIHLVIDACNAWFMLHPRKPGAKRVVRKDLGDGLLERDPRVGALLSTSAEATTWEWSEIQSGLFSHTLRSGLRGGADVDRDRRLTYRELDAFLAIANETVPEAYRPRLFLRAPRATTSPPDDTFVTLASRSTRRLSLPTERHIALRDARGVRVLDGHFEAGPALDLAVPPGRLWLDEAVTVDARTMRRTQLIDDAVTELAPTPTDATTPEVAARGELMRVEQLFAQPFGPTSFARWAAAPSVDEAPYGVSRQDADRLGHILRSAARLEARSRQIGGVTAIGAGLLSGIAGATLVDDPIAIRSTLGWTLVGVGTAGIVAGSVALVVPATLEDLDLAYRDAPRDSERDRALTVARFERLLEERADDYRTTRLWTAGISIGIGVIGLGVGTGLAISRGFDDRSAMLLGTGAFIGGLGAFGFATKHQVEEVWDLYKDLRELPWLPGVTPEIPLQPVLAPTEGGLVLGIGGGF